jgi:hypothetical protein
MLFEFLQQTAKDSESSLLASDGGWTGISMATLAL